MNIIRIHKDNEFKYVSKKGEIIKDEKILDRIKKIRIPPAWTNVIIANNEKEEVQAMGEDIKGRTQYIYSKEWTNNQEKSKFIRLIYFSKTINYIRKNIRKVLKEEGWFKEKMIAFLIYIIDNCGLRIGNEKYKELYDTHGITTLKKNHIKISDNKVELKFIGKKNVVNTCIIKTKLIIKLFKELDKYNSPSKEEYFFTLDNKIISNSSVNNYLKKYGDYTVKDFRTYRANVDLIKCLYNAPAEEKITRIKKEVNKCLDTIASRLNNTRAVLKNKYICNIILEKYIEDSKKFRKKIKYYEKNKSQGVNTYESALLYYLKMF
jgi:DNA topoisomerase I